MEDLNGKVALVTGGGRGIGAAIARALAAEGARVAVAARSASEVDAVASEIEAQGGTALAFAGDLADGGVVHRVVDATTHGLGAIDILVNNAAVIGPLGPFAAIDPDDWTFAVAINLVAPAVLTRAVLPGMLDRRWGRIVNVSTGAVNNLSRNDTYNAYLTTKAGLEAHTLNLAAELAGTGVTANALRPGIVDTAMQTHIRGQDPERIGVEFHQRFVQRYVDGALLAPETPARLLVELVTSDRNGELASTSAPGSGR